MYSVVIADDDKSIQKGLAEAGWWKELGFEVLGTFEDGEQLIEFLRNVQVDVVLTDIKMTYMDGIEVAKFVHENLVSCKVVFISAYKEFELALQAIQYGVKDYILKPTVEEKLIEVFGKIRKELDERAQDVELKNQMDTYWKELRPILIEKFVNSLIMGALKDRNMVFQRMKFLYPDIDVQHCPCALVEIQIAEYDQLVQGAKAYGAQQLSDAVYGFINLYQEDGYYHVVFKYKDQIRMFLIMKNSCESFEDGYTLCQQQITQFCKTFQEIFELRVSANIEKVFGNVYEVIDYQANNLQIDTEKEKGAIYLQQSKLEIMDNVRDGNIGVAQSIIRNCLIKVFEVDISCGKLFVKDIFEGMTVFLSEKNPVEAARMRRFFDYNIVSEIGAAHEIILYCERIFDRLKSLEDMHVMTDEPDLLNRVIEYVNSHIYADICLEDVANECFVSVRHLRRVFKNQTGETFLQYVTARKMEKARELLQYSDYKVYQVSERLGYRTSRHFAKLFYNHYGYYPSQVRQEVGESERDYEGK